MSAIEPNVVALLWFAGLCALACIAFFAVIGFYPIEVKRRSGSALPATLATLANTALFLALLAGTVVFGVHELRVTSMLIVGGFAFLYAPEALQALPERLREGLTGHVALLAVLCIGLASCWHAGSHHFLTLL